MIFLSSVFLILTVLLLSGRGSFLVAGYNALSKEEKKQFNKKSVSRQAGWLLALVDIPIILSTILDYYGKMKELYATIAGVYMVLVVIVFFIIGNRRKRKDK